jgi:predicted transcriptional regulator
MEWLVKNPRLHVLHGHLHKAVDRLAGNMDRSRIFGAPATVDDVHAPRVRLYDVRDGMLESAGILTA